MKNNVLKSRFLAVFIVFISIGSLNAQWSFVGSLNASDGVYGMVMSSNKNIYVGGDFRNTAYNRYVAVWNGSDWDSCGIATWNPGGQIRGMAIDTADNVYVSWLQTGNGRQVQKWDGNTWAIVGALNVNNEVKVLHIDKKTNILYAAGRFNVAPHYSESVMKWDGNTWADLGQIATTPGEIMALATDNNGNLYVAGEFKNANSKFYVAKFDGNSWSELGSGGNELNAGDRIRALHVDASGNVYAGGGFKNGNNKTYLAKWNGTSWTDLGLGVANTSNDDIYAIASDASGNLYVGGTFYNIANLQKYIAFYNGSEWSELGGEGSLTSITRLEDLIVDGCDVYASGAISNTGGMQVLKYACPPVSTYENFGSDVTIYPSLVNEGFSVQNRNANQLSVYNSLGQVVYVNFEKEKTYHDISHLNKGVYFVQIESDKGISVKKIFKN